MDHIAGETGDAAGALRAEVKKFIPAPPEAVYRAWITPELLGRFLAAQLRRRGSTALGGVSLIAVLVSLIATDLLSEGLSISGVGTWIAATVIV